MSVPVSKLPRFLVLEPVSTVKIEMELRQPACELDVELQSSRAERSFVLLLGKRGGPYLQRLRLSGRARILFRPRAPGTYLLMVANPHKEPLVLRLRGRDIRRRRRGRSAKRRARTGVRGPRAGRGPLERGAARRRPTVRIGGSAVRIAHRPVREPSLHARGGGPADPSDRSDGPE